MPDSKTNGDATPGFIGRRMYQNWSKKK